MKAIFPGYYRLSDEDLKSIWKTATVVLDTNVLLNFYRYSEKVKKDFLKVLEKVSDRLWVPYHAALEYQRNRLSVIADQNKRFDEVKGIVREARSNLSKLEGLQLKKRHSSIDPEPFLQKVKDACQEFFDRLDDIRTNQLEVNDEDTIRTTLEKLLNEKIGPPPTDQKYLDQLYAEGEERFKASTPPGYMDKSKSGTGETTSFVCNGLSYQRRFGDLILWKQILAFARDKKPKGIIFVTDDKKEDWWLEIDALGKKTIAPRPELVEEIHRIAQTPFIMYSSESFMVNSNEFLSVQVSQESINQIRDLAEVVKQATEFVPNLGESLIEAVANWYKAAFPGEYHIESQHGEYNPDLIIKKNDKAIVTVDVRLLRENVNVNMLENVLRDNKLSRGNAAYYYLVVIAPPAVSGQFLKSIAQAVSTDYETRFDSVFLGYIEKPNIFAPRWKVSRLGLERMV